LSGYGVWSFLYNHVKGTVLRSARYAEPNFGAVGAVGALGFPLYYFVWHDLFPQPYENLPLRLVGGLLCFLLMLHRRWPPWAQRFLPLYSYGVILYALPFYFTFMLLKNESNSIWIMSDLVAVFLLIVLVDWLNLVILFVLGSGLAWIAYVATTADPTAPHVYLELVAVYLFAIVSASAFSYKTALIRQEKLETALTVASNVAHELRTPLLGIKSGALGLKRYLPTLVQGYRLAREAGLPVRSIRSRHFGALERVLDRIEAEADNSNVIIDMLLMNAGRRPIEPEEFAVHSIATCVNQALDRYPFQSEYERRQVHWVPEHDFRFFGSDLLLVHVLFNLIKNALYFTARAGKGEVRIWLEPGPETNRLHFLDTGPGVRPEALPHIFERFYTGLERGEGTGIGLAFCKMVMEGLGGRIEARSELGQYTEMVLSFPALPAAGATH
jgi:signal transduction histidine kinase